MDTPFPSYRQHRYPAEVSAHCVRLYYRFPLSYRGVEELMFERGVVVSYETIRRWCLKCGPVIAAGLRRRRPQPKDTWRRDEMHIKMNGKTYLLVAGGGYGRDGAGPLGAGAPQPGGGGDVPAACGGRLSPGAAGRGDGQAGPLWAGCQEDIAPDRAP